MRVRWQTMDDRRRMIDKERFWRCVVMILALLLALPQAVDAQGNGVIEGQVTVSGGAALPEDLEAELLFLPNGQGPPTITAQPLGEDGTVRFEGLDTSPQHVYLLRVTVEGEENMSDLLTFAEGETVLEVTLPLFERTNDASALSLPQVAYVLDARANGWVVVTLYQFLNGGERTIVNLTDPPAEIPLPEGATNVQFEPGVDYEAVVETPEGFAYTGPFPPGETSLVFSYVLPYEEGEQTVTLPLGIPAQQVRVLLPQLGQQTEVENLTSGGAQAGPNGEPFELFQAVEVPGTESFTLRFTGLPPAPTPVAESEAAPDAVVTGPRVVPISPLQRLPRWAPLIPMAVAAAGVLGYVVTRPTPSSAEQRATLRTRRDTLVAEIAALDIRFEAGAIGEQTHKRQRAALKDELKEVLRRLGAGVAEGSG